MADDSNSSSGNTARRVAQVITTLSELNVGVERLAGYQARLERAHTEDEIASAESSLAQLKQTHEENLELVRMLLRDPAVQATIERLVVTKERLEKHGIKF